MQLSTADGDVALAILKTASRTRAAPDRAVSAGVTNCVTITATAIGHVTSLAIISFAAYLIGTARAFSLTIRLAQRDLVYARTSGAPAVTGTG